MVRSQNVLDLSSPKAKFRDTRLVALMLKSKMPYDAWKASYWSLNPRQCKGGVGVGVHPPWVFLKWPPNRWADHAEILHSLWSIFCATLGKKSTGACQVMEQWRHERNSLRPIFKGNHIFSQITCRSWLEWRYNAWFSSAHGHIWPLTFHVDLGKVIRGYWPCLAPCLPIVANLERGFGVSWGHWTEYVANFSHIDVYSDSLHYTVSISAIEPVCLQAILAMIVTLFPSETLCVTNILSIRYNNTLFS